MAAPNPSTFAPCRAALRVCAVACLLLAARLAGGQALEEAPPFRPPPLLGEAPPADTPAPMTQEPTLADPALADEPPAAEELPLPPVDRLAAELAERLRADHPWARFGPGAWRRVRVVAETFDADGAFVGRSSTERTERLVSVGDSRFTIDETVVVALAGRRTPGPTSSREVSLLTESPVGGATITVARGEASSISLGGVVIPCESFVVSQDTPSGREVDTVYLCDKRAPVVLRREEQSFVGEEPASRRTRRVTQVGLPTVFADRLIETWRVVASVDSAAGGRSVAVSTHAADVPGGMLSTATSDYDATGHRTRWAVSELVAYGRTAEETIELIEPDERPAVEIGVRPRRLLRLLRRGEPETPPTTPL